MLKNVQIHLDRIMNIPWISYNKICIIFNTAYLEDMYNILTFEVINNVHEQTSYGYLTDVDECYMY
jgi:hypothetical protein